MSCCRHWHWKSGNKVGACFGEESIPEDVIEIYKRNLSKTVRGELENLKDYSMHFEEHYLIADVTLSSPFVEPNGEIKVSIDFSVKPAYEDMPHTASLRWILPEGFTAEGKKSLYIPRGDRHTAFSNTMDFTLRAGDTTDAENRIVLEVTAHDRHTAMYISFVLLG